MSFTTPPAFADGDILSASQLNVLAANQNYLAGMASAINPGFREVTLADADDSQYYSVLHQHDWLYIIASGGNSVRIYTSLDNFTTAIATIYTSGGTVVEAVDIAGVGLTVGAWVRYRLRGEGGYSVTVRYFAEDSADRTA